LPSGSNSGIIHLLKIKKDSKMREMILDMVDEILDQEGDIKIGNSTFSRSAIMRELDPVAYREMVADMVDSFLTDLKDELENTDDAEEREEIQERIDMLEYVTY
jgi:hypothetical protein